jgi:hypothetical protein
MNNELCSKCKERLKQNLYSIKQMLATLDNLPSHVMQQPVNHYDFYSTFSLISEILEDLSCKSDICPIKDEN